MHYKYVTDNNLFNRQNYMYSEYGGEDFLNTYKHTREQGIEALENCDEKRMDNIHLAYDELCQIRQWCRDGKLADAKAGMDLYVKTFEVRKRLYAEYDNLWKPMDRAGFENYETYLVFAECLIMMYKQSKCMKYFSCLLKCNDAMLSVCQNFTDRQKGLLADILRSEVDIYDEIARGIRAIGETCQ